MLYLSNIWKNAGWGTIIYMAAIAGVDVQMYEAAYLDGANRFQQMRFITLPAITFSVTTMLILNAGSILGANFDQIINLRTDPTMKVSTVIDTYVFDQGVGRLQYGLTARRNDHETNQGWPGPRRSGGAAAGGLWPRKEADGQREPATCERHEERRHDDARQ